MKSRSSITFCIFATLDLVPKPYLESTSFNLLIYKQLGGLLNGGPPIGELYSAAKILLFFEMRKRARSFFIKISLKNAFCPKYKVLFVLNIKCFLSGKMPFFPSLPLPPPLEGEVGWGFLTVIYR